MHNSQSIKKVIVIGSGPIVIGQAAEFDYAGTQACLALKEEGIEVVLLNNNPATIMTDEQIADRVYLEPLTVETVEEIIQLENPDGLIGSLGGQTGLNLTMELEEKGILNKHGVKLLGTSVSSIKQGEDREMFRSLMHEIHEPTPASEIVESVREGVDFVEKIGYPVILRPAYTLGGGGGGFAYSREELEDKLYKALKASPIHQVLVERSIKGWKEVEYEVMRDANDTCIIVCNMENLDPVGVHTGDSIVTAPSQTLSDRQYQMLRDSSLKVIRALDVIGGCNIQFAVHPEKEEYAIIEVNPRVSRSSALASKATGYPIARIAAKVAVGYQLDEIINPITGNTYASFEPALDYIVVKLPRFPFDKFSEADRTLGTQMKATGEVMALDRTFEGAMFKAIRSLEMNVQGLHWKTMPLQTDEELRTLLEEPNDLRLFALAEAFRRDWSEQHVHELTGIDFWYLLKLRSMTALEDEVQKSEWSEALLKKAKKWNLGDARIAELTGRSEMDIRMQRVNEKLYPGYKLVDTCAGEFDAETPYYYSTWHGADEVETKHEKKKLLVIGSGPIRIGQGVEFDYCSVHAAEAVKALGYEAVVMNNNPETVSTDYSVADSLYFEPLTTEDVLHVAWKEKIDGVLLQFGGQTAVNLAESLKEAGLPILGTTPEAIDRLEDREQFYSLLNELNIAHIEGNLADSEEGLHEAAASLGFPVLVRPSYVIGGQSMYICYGPKELDDYVKRLAQTTNDRCWPLLVDRFLPGMECEVDVISDGKDVFIPGIFEHIEKAGVHSGDSTTVFPAQSLSKEQENEIVSISRAIAENAPVSGMMNIQFVLHDNTVYVLEVNPRASRTVPIMSKVTGVKMVEEAVKAQLGIPMQQTGLMTPPDHITVKAPVYSVTKLKGVDHALSPEMKSTGEKIGIAATLDEAVEKVFPAGVDVKNIYVSASERSREELLPVFQKLDAHLAASKGTKAFLEVHHIDAELLDDLSEIEKRMKNGELDVVINIPKQGRNPGSFGFQVRELAAAYSVTCFTHADTAALYFQSRPEKTTPVAVQDLSLKQKERA
ncbi:carbamoyl-phosphate synthase (glutamine-hydrolyzing) large subunit [Alkalicoccus urumqiensis]|uniref:Carbamoyl phosphate synthase large chain n=1 Tax=Alkalicoccus urumqiensis TaxID=1548213 RepID=A0A2P6MKX4_ALKUR|nr:carbamoyl-phosphate synthase (glutamine-hydrolyzing) large subunit [Alkalicoccus urumqiensis]PRO66926.1 carbamoyl-phosphate synthase large subunit [Alkalicoccus urumqiensis]